MVSNAGVTNGNASQRCCHRFLYVCLCPALCGCVALIFVWGPVWWRASDLAVCICLARNRNYERVGSFLEKLVEYFKLKFLWFCSANVSIQASSSFLLCFLWCMLLPNMLQVMVQWSSELPEEWWKIFGWNTRSDQKNNTGTSSKKCISGMILYINIRDL